MSETLVPETLFQRLLRAGSTELPPVCAIMGGIVGQVYYIITKAFSRCCLRHFLIKDSDRALLECCIEAAGITR